MQVDYRRKDIVWTASDYDPRSDVMSELPYIELVEYDQKFSATLANLYHWFQRYNSTRNEQYFDGLYVGEPTGNAYILPWFTQQHRSTSNTWVPNDAPLSKLSSWMNTLGSKTMQMLYPAAGIIYPHTYQGTGLAQYTISFPLINTVDRDSISKNLAFIRVIARHNLPEYHARTLAITPPSLYTAYIPGIRWSPVAVMTDVKVNNIGTLNKLSLTSSTGIVENVIVPDVWNVELTISELVPESRSIYDGAFISGSIASQRNSGVTTRVSVIASPANVPFAENIQRLQGIVSNLPALINTGVNKVTNLIP